MTIVSRKALTELVDMVRSGGLGNPEHAAREIVKDLPKPVVADLAASYLAGLVRREDRLTTLRLERASQSAVSDLAAENASASIARGRTTRWSQEQIDAHRKRQAERESELVEWEAANNKRMWDSINDAIDRFKESVKVEWTAELLAAGFTLPDGTMTTWGAATAVQHEQRRQMFLNNAAANVEGASRHEQAIDALRKAGASCLDELLKAERATAHSGVSG